MKLKSKLLKKTGFQKISLFFFVILGALYIYYTLSINFRIQSDEFIQITRSIEIGLSKDNIKNAKTNTAEKTILTNTLNDIVDSNNNLKSASIYSIHKGSPETLIASNKTKDGTPFTHNQLFKSSKELVSNPIIARQWKSLSVVVPIKELNTLQTATVLVIDYDPKIWNAILFYNVIESITIVILFLTAFFFLIRIKSNNIKLKKDLSTRKEMENKLRESEIKYRSLFDNVQDVFYRTDLEGNFLEVSPSIKQFTNLNKEELMQFKVVDFYENPRDRFKMINLILKEGELRDYELKLKMKSGIIKYASINAKLILDASGNPSHIDGALRDITDREQAKEKLIESEYRLRTIIETEPECIKIVDENGKLVMMNPAGLAMIQADSLEQVLGNTVTDVIAPEYRRTFAKMHKRILAGESMRREFEILGLKGRRLWLETNAVPMLYHGKVVHLAHTRNITERKLAEEKLRRSELFLKETQIIARLGTYVLNIQDGSWSSSNILDSILGLDSFDTISTLSWTSVIHPDYKELIQDHFINDVLSKKSNFNKEFKILCKANKEERWVHVLGEILFNELNNPLKMIGTVQDITEQKKVEAELIIAKEKAEESDRLKSAFLTNMSHEIRTPMNGILGFAELLKEVNLSNEEKSEYIEIIEKSGVRMLNIINDIIDVSKIESGLMKVSIAETNINHILNHIYRFFKPEAENNGIQLTYINPYPLKEIIVKTDKEKVYAILTNLVKNAIKFTQSGTIEIGFQIKAVKQNTTGMSEYLFEPFELEFYVKDTGSGIDENHQSLIFDRFRQVSESYTRNHEGAGLGLSISKSFAEMLGGKMNVKSTIGIGSTFFFTLPHNGNEINIEKEIISVLSSKNSTKIKKLKILIAEDDEISAKLLTLTTKKFCKEIIRARNGAEAIEICKSHPDIDLILMDMQMPEMNGLQTTLKIREFNTEVIIIAQTAYAFSKDKKRTIDSGCNDYLSKPVNKESLLLHMQKYFTEVKSSEVLV
ncbi:hybrid sensor histidine kinase/response regulator [Flavobacterium sp. K5-23]|uniref:hybrid sensor histidine kinase/response regulator n=1 Tax=Flavobacterium sp. K5-23 TaxID=2746225 RepID=UPI00200E73CC|nr:hybrid sensor histidine kinase/response regulator [Flavobacterium sp. K5-23]UQD56480.1 PAS domain S-box protein [Flavobacterium sp. K5-23]